MGYFCKIIMLHKCYFWVKHILENYLWDYIFVKSIVLWPYCIQLFMKNDIIFGNAYGEMHDLLAWKRVASLIKFLRMDFISYCIICKIKDALIFGKIDTKSSWQEMSLKALRTLWIFWIFQRFLWNYLKLNCVWISCKLWALYVFPLGCDMWLSGDYLDRYYSLCDLGILAPVFVMVISFGFVSAMSSSFVLTN